MSYLQETYNKQHPLKPMQNFLFGAKLSQYVIHSVQNKTLVSTAKAFTWKTLNLPVEVSELPITTLKYFCLATPASSTIKKTFVVLEFDFFEMLIEQR